MELKLTRQEQRVIEYLLMGLNSVETAYELGISARTVKAHLNRLYIKFDINCKLYIAKIVLAVKAHDERPDLCTCCNISTDARLASLWERATKKRSRKLSTHTTLRQEVLLEQVRPNEATVLDIFRTE